jgi:hypothetical protein
MRRPDGSSAMWRELPMMWKISLACGFLAPGRVGGTPVVSNTTPVPDGGAPEALSEIATLC